MAEVNSEWQPARLIPVAGIRGQEEQEARSASAFLAVLSAVPEFSHALLGDLGAPKTRAQTFTEVRFRDAEGKQHRPDGAIVVTRGSRTWSALVEVKTGAALLDASQVNRYLDVARDNGFDAVLTISNEITAKPEDAPVAVDRRKLRRVALYHLSWWKIVTTAVLQHRFRGVRDVDQAWILGELIAYLDHENSGASGFQDMGSSWVAVREGVLNGTQRATDPTTRDVVEHWEQFIDYLALGMSRDLGRDVEPIRPRKQGLVERIEAGVRTLTTDGRLSVSIRVPDAAAAIGVTADLRTRQVTTTVDVSAPRDGRQLTRVNWLLRQLADAPGSLRITTSFANTRETESDLLSVARDDPSKLLSPSDARREIRGFEVAMSRPLGQKNGRGKGSFIADTRQQVLDFYAIVVQNLNPWQPKAPRLPDAPADVPETPQSEPPPFVAAAEREVGDARLPDEPRYDEVPPDPIQIDGRPDQKAGEVEGAVEQTTDDPASVEPAAASSAWSWPPQVIPAPVHPGQTPRVDFDDGLASAE